MRINSYKSISIGICIVLFCLISKLHAEQIDHESLLGQKQSETESGNFYMTADYHFFKYRLHAMLTTAQNLDMAIKSFPRFSKLVEEFLKNNDDIRAGQYVHISGWGGLYCNLPLLTGKKDAVKELSPSYVLSLLFCGYFKRAQKTAKEILEKEPDNYGILLLLGLLSIYDKENFPYLERAFQLNPYKTIWIFDWHLNNFFILPSKDWDFVHAYFLLLAKHRKLLRSKKIPTRIALRLSSSFLLKYEDPKKAFLNYKEIEPEMRELASIIRRNLTH